MKRILYITIAALGLMSAGGCSKNGTNSATATAQASRDIVHNLVYTYINPFSTIIQNTYFFSTYCDILEKSTEEMAALYEGIYLGGIDRNKYELDSTHFRYDGGVCKGDADGEYTAYSSKAVNGLPEFRINFTDSLSFTASREWADDESVDNAAFDFHAEVSIMEDGLTVEVSNLTINYSETGEYGNISVRIETVENIHCDIYGSSQLRVSWPRSGLLYVTISGDYTDNVEMTYNYPYCIITCENGDVFRW